MKDKFKHSLSKLDVKSIVTEFNLDLEGSVQVEIDGKQKVVSLQENLNLYKCNIKGYEFSTRAVNRRRAIQNFKKLTRKSFGKQVIPIEVFIFSDDKWQIAK